MLAQPPSAQQSASLPCGHHAKLTFRSVRWASGPLAAPAPSPVLGKKEKKQKKRQIKGKLEEHGLVLPAEL